jgi:rhombotail lipoprotein
MKIIQWLGVVGATLALLAGCETALQEKTQTRKGASVVQYLFPTDATAAALAPANLATLRVPLRIGVAFVPEASSAAIGATEVQQQQMLAQVVKAFERYPFVAELKPIPTSYLRTGGGFPDLEAAARLFDIDVVALLSYDQVQFTEKTGKSMWYWTLIGAYIAEGDQYDVHTMIEATVLDVKSRRLLMRAAGTHVQHGGATMATVAENTRAAREAGFQQALTQMIPHLHEALAAFREKARAGAASGVELKLPPGYDPAASRPSR